MPNTHADETRLSQTDLEDVANINLRQLRDDAKLIQRSRGVSLGEALNEVARHCPVRPFRDWRHLKASVENARATLKTQPPVKVTHRHVRDWQAYDGHSEQDLRDEGVADSYRVTVEDELRQRGKMFVTFEREDDPLHFCLSVMIEINHGVPGVYFGHPGGDNLLLTYFAADGGYVETDGQKWSSSAGTEFARRFQMPPDRLAAIRRVPFDLTWPELGAKRSYFDPGPIGEPEINVVWQVDTATLDAATANGRIQGQKLNAALGNVVEDIVSVESDGYRVAAKFVFNRFVWQLFEPGTEESLILGAPKDDIPRSEQSVRNFAMGWINRRKGTLAKSSAGEQSALPALSAGMRAFFEAEIRNEADGGESPSSLNSAHGSFVQMPEDVLLDLNAKMRAAAPDPEALERELQALIDHYGGQYLLEDLLDQR